MTKSKEVAVVSQFLDEGKDLETIAEELHLPIDEVESYINSTKKQAAIKVICENIADSVLAKTAPVMKAIAGTSQIMVFEWLNELYSKGSYKEMTPQQMRVVSDISKNMAELALIHEGKPSVITENRIVDTNKKMSDIIVELQENDEFGDYEDIEVEDEEG